MKFAACLHPIVLSLATPVSRLLLAAALVVPVAARADPGANFVSYLGEGNVADFGNDTGGWVGEIDQVSAPGLSDPLALTSIVNFSIDASTHLLTGRFLFDTTDLTSSLYGRVIGWAPTDFLSSGGTLTLDYILRGGTGSFAGAHGFGASLLAYDPAGTFNNYQERGLLVFSSPVPEPATLALFASGLLAVALRRRRGQPVN